MLLEKDRFFKFAKDYDNGGEISNHDGGSNMAQGEGRPSNSNDYNYHIDNTNYVMGPKYGGTKNVNTDYDVLYWWTGDIDNYPGTYDKSTNFAARRTLKSKKTKGAYKYTWQEIKEKFIVVDPLQEAGCLSDGEKCKGDGYYYNDRTYKTTTIKYPLQFTRKYGYGAWSYYDSKALWDPSSSQGTGFRVDSDDIGTYSYTDGRWYKYPVYKNGYEPYEYRIRKAEKLQKLLQLYLPINPDNNFSTDFWEKVFTKDTELLKTLNFYLTKIREIKAEILGIKESLLAIDFDKGTGEGEKLTTRQLATKLQELAGKLDTYNEKYQTADKLRVSLFDSIIKSTDENNVIPVPTSCNFYYNYNTYKYDDGYVYGKGSDETWKLVAFNSMLPKIKEWGTRTNTNRPTGTPGSQSLKEVWDMPIVYIKNATYYKGVRLNVTHKTWIGGWDYDGAEDEEEVWYRYLERYGSWVYGT